MTMTTSDLHFDMYDRGIHASPYPVYRRLRDEAPLYRNDEYDFFVVSRFDDVSRVLSDREVFLSGKGNVYNILAAGIEIPNGLFISEAAAWFNDYLDHRAEHPTDDLMTQLLHMEFEDETGMTRKLEREEILTDLVLVVGAGSDTTGTAIGWAASLLADNPDQRRMLREDSSLMASTIDKVLRFESVSYHICRSLAEDVELHGQVIPAGSTIVALPGSANRDDRHFDDADTFDIRREPGQIMTFSFGPHYCLGASLAKVEMRIALEAVLERFPEWTVDHDAATMIGGIDMRGWDTLPVEVVER